MIGRASICASGPMPGKSPPTRSGSWTSCGRNTRPEDIRTTTPREPLKRYGQGKPMGIKAATACLTVHLLCSWCLADEPTLEARLAPLAKAHQGKVAIAVKHLNTGETYLLNADEPMPTASLIKFPVMIEVYQQVADGQIKFTDTVTLRSEDKVPGSGVLTNNFSDGVTFPLRDAMCLMISVSDNTATNLVLDKIGIGATAKRMEEWGYK